MKQLKIAIDYDNTYTADPALWNEFIAVSLGRGHIVFVATARSATRDINDQLRDLQATVPVYFCDGVAKRFWCLHFGPGDVDIWIDDKPENVDKNSTFQFSELHKWRADCSVNEPGHPGILPYDHLGEPHESFKVVERPLTPVNDKPPMGVFIDFPSGTFRDHRGNDKGFEFYKQWSERWREFPVYAG